MRDKKVIIFIVLSVFAVVSLMHGISARPKGRAKRAYTEPGGSVRQPSSQEAFSAQRRAKRSKLTSWKRSPFVSTHVPGMSSSLTLNGILGSGANLKAMIGDAFFSEGDKVGNNTVVAVKKNSVILNDGTKDFEIKLKE